MSSQEERTGNACKTEAQIKNSQKNQVKNIKHTNRFINLQLV
jgi:hypothetical protein